MVEQVIEVIEVPVGDPHRIPEHARIGAFAADQAPAHPFVHQRLDRFTIELLVEPFDEPADLGPAQQRPEAVDRLRQGMRRDAIARAPSRPFVAQVDVGDDGRRLIGPDRRPRSIEVSQVLRAEQDGVDRWITVYDWDEVTPHPAQLFPLRNCRTGRVAVNLDEHIMVAELLFERPLSRGETLIMEHKMVNPPELRNAETIYFRRFRLPVRDYVLEIQFDPDTLPRVGSL